MPEAGLSRLKSPPSRLIWTRSPSASASLEARTRKNESVSEASARIAAESWSNSSIRRRHCRQGAETRCRWSWPDLLTGRALTRSPPAIPSCARHLAASSQTNLVPQQAMSAPTRGFALRATPSGRALSGSSTWARPVARRADGSLRSARSRAASRTRCCSLSRIRDMRPRRPGRTCPDTGSSNEEPMPLP